MQRVIACLDGSDYDTSVCDHAAWIAGGADAEVLLLHAVEAADTASNVIEHGLERLREHAGITAKSIVLIGQFLSVLAENASSTDFVVAGKRGAETQGDFGRLGANIDRIIATTDFPALLVSKLFLPIHRAGVFMDSDVGHRRAVEFVAGSEVLRQLDLRLVGLDGASANGKVKGEWAADLLSTDRAHLMTIRSASIDHAADELLEVFHPDLFVLSREALLASGELRLNAPSRQFWRWRTPILIC